MKKHKIVFILPSLRAGGAERVMSFIADNIDRNKFSPHLLVVESNKDVFYKVSNIPVTHLNKKRVRDAIFTIAKFLSIHKPHIVISAIGHVNNAMTLLAPFYPNIKFIGRETLVPSGEIDLTRKKRSLLSRLKPKILDIIICQSEDMRVDFIDTYGYPANKIVIINNPITESFDINLNSTHLPVSTEKRFVTVGRLVPQKGHLRILSVLKQIKFPFHYTIIGDGQQKENILNYAKKNGLTDKLTVIPFTDNVAEYLSKSDFFLQGSYVEGFPNALLESCAVGTPIIAYNALGGINEIIINDINGYVVESELEFIKILNQAIQKKWDRTDIRDSVIQKYSQEKILGDYEKLFLKLTD